MKKIAVVILWILLLWWVIRAVNTDGYEPMFLVTLAFFAWLGGLVTNEIIRLIIHEWKTRNDRNPKHLR